MNPHKGEVELKAGDKVYVLRYSIDAICELEERTGKGFPVLAMEMMDPNRLRIGLVRDILHAGLLEKHPDITLKEAGELMLAAGGVDVVMKSANKAFAVAFPKTEARGAPRPTNQAERRKAGTGSVS